MELVNQTLGQVLLFGGIISSVLLTWHLILHAIPWMRAAIAGVWLLTGGIWMVVFAEEPSSASAILIRNLAMIGGTACLWRACRMYLGQKSPWWPLPAGLLALGLMLLVVDRHFPGPAPRAAVFSTHVAAWNAAMAWAFLRSGAPGPIPMRKFAVTLFGLNALVNAGRALLMASLPAGADLLIPTALTYFYALVFLILQALVLWGMGDQADPLGL